MSLSIKREFTIDAPTDRVWSILGDEFADVAHWASGLDSSGRNPNAIDFEDGAVRGAGLRGPRIRIHRRADRGARPQDRHVGVFGRCREDPVGRQRHHEHLDVDTTRRWFDEGEHAPDRTTPRSDWDDPEADDEP